MQPAAAGDHFPLQGVTLAFLAEFLESRRGDIGDLTTAEVCRTIIIPETKARGCSYTQLLLSADGAGDTAGDTAGGAGGTGGEARHVGERATVFVSHAWESPFASLVEALLQLRDASAWL